MMAEDMMFSGENCLGLAEGATGRNRGRGLRPEATVSLRSDWKNLRRRLAERALAG
jgi:hypothetical protein